jgi:glycosyltransferase involved in cell wall biosynthesis
MNAASYRALVFSPYLFWTSFACGQISPERTILRPCLHDEPQARLELFGPLFSGVRGLWFNADPERDLAASLFDLPSRQRVVGEGFDIPTAYDPDGFRSRYGIDGRFVLYAGRREGAKRWEWLLEAFAAATIEYDLPFKLVTFGSGEVHPPDEIADRVIDLGFVPNADRNDAFAAADAYLQPSSLESFSRTVMEAWLAGTPVIASESSSVVRWHCERSQAGLTFADEEELTECLRFVADEPEAAAKLALAGREYVLQNYQWPGVLDVMEQTIEEWMPL